MANDDARTGSNPGGRSQGETVDDILAGILNADGSFNDEFGALLTKYLGDDAAHVASLRGIDLSSRVDEPRIRQRVEYEAPDARHAYERGIDRRIEEKIPEAVRPMYNAAASEAQRPEFTATGGVRYPAMGVGDSEERVVYDAEWEERARQEAARLQRVREDRMLRGDSTYVRSFVANGRQMRPGRSPFIDPLSADDDFDEVYRYGQGRQDDNRPFFQEGPPVNQARNRAGRQRNAGSAGGRTEYMAPRRGGSREDDVFESFSDSYERAEEARAAWLQPDDRTNETGRRRRNDRRRSQREQMTSTLRDDYDRLSFLREGEGGRPVRPPREPETLTQPPRARQPEPEEQEPAARPADPEELSRAQQEAQGLRSTVAQIVDKYNKRSEEEAEARGRALKEEMERQEAERQAREEFLRQLSSEIADALYDEEDPEAQAEGYDDLSGACAQGGPAQTDSLRAFAAAHSDAGAGEEDPAPDYSEYLDEYTEPGDAPEEAAPAAEEAAADTADEPDGEPDTDTEGAADAPDEDDGFSEF